mmetsp:Transcript_48695/g.143845  ORF Transcript_48695/g.143845 Transcript_48695/m.143845 type:complete len:107 (+) Transcript_48695:1-321(+)
MEVAVASDSRRSLVVLEIGCGERVPAVRTECQAVVRDTMRRGGQAVLIRINPGACMTDHDSVGDGEDDGLGREQTIIIKNGALAALEAIDAQMRNRGSIPPQCDRQ